MEQKKELENNYECFQDLTAILSGIKAQLLRCTKITGRIVHAAIADKDVSEVSDCELEDIKDVANHEPQTEVNDIEKPAPSQEEETNFPMEKTIVAQLEASLLTNLTKEKYNSTAK